MSAPTDVSFYGSKSTAVADGETGHDGLGGYRSADEILSLLAIPLNIITGVALLKVSGECGSGNGVLTFASGTGLATFKAPKDATAGASVNISAGGTFTLFSGTNPNAYITIVVTAVNLPTGTFTETLRINPINNVLMDDVAADEAQSGVVNYRAFFLKNVSGGALASLFPVFDTGLAATQILADSDYGPSGAFDIQVVDASTWPISGFFRNITAGGEILYYSERRGNRLIGGPSGRRRRGTSMMSGDAGDKIEPIGPVDIALEMPSSNKISVILDETAPPPVSVQFFHPTDLLPAAADFVIPSLAAGSYIGIWLRRQTPLNTPELLRQQTRLLFKWTS